MVFCRIQRCETENESHLPPSGPHTIHDGLEANSHVNSGLDMLDEDVSKLSILDECPCSFPLFPVSVCGR